MARGSPEEHALAQKPVHEERTFNQELSTLLASSHWPQGALACNVGRASTQRSAVLHNDLGHREWPSLPHKVFNLHWQKPLADLRKFLHAIEVRTLQYKTRRSNVHKHFAGAHPHNACRQGCD